MSSSPQTCVTVEEGVPLRTSPGSGTTGNQVITKNRSSWKHRAPSLCDDKHHRKLAKCSIICGLSCIGIKALTYSVKAEEATDPETAEKFSQQARKCGIISIVTWICCLASIPILLALISYLITLKD